MNIATAKITHETNLAKTNVWICISRQPSSVIRSIGGGAGRFDDLRPLEGLGPNVGAEFLRRAADRIGAELDQPVTDLRSLDRAYDLCLKLCHDVAGQVRGTEQAEPGRCLEIGKSRVGDGRNVGYGRRS